MIIIPLVLVFSCSPKADQESLKIAFSQFVVAVQKGDYSGLVKAAPFLATLDPATKETTLRTLQKLLENTPRFSVKLTDGRWTISEYLETRGTIDFIPRKEVP